MKDTPHPWPLSAFFSASCPSLPAMMFHLTTRPEATNKASQIGTTGAMSQNKSFLLKQVSLSMVKHMTNTMSKDQCWCIWVCVCVCVHMCLGTLVEVKGQLCGFMWSPRLGLELQGKLLCLLNHVRIISLLSGLKQGVTL